MNQIRKSDEKEHVVLCVECEMPTFHKILFISAYILGMFLIVLGIVLLSRSDGGSGGVSLFFGLAIILPVAIAHGIFAYCVHCTNVTITNKTIKGTIVNRNRPTIKYRYNRRLDMIDDVQYVKTFLGIKSLIFTFTQGVDKEIGANTSKTLSINYVKDAESVYQKISQLIVKEKNDKEVKADIATQQIDAQLKQAKAFETLAEHVTKKEEPVVANNSDEAKQLKQLKELYDEGIISKEDFQEMIKKIINK